MSSVTVKVRSSPSSAETFSMVTAALPSSLLMVPVAVSLLVTVWPAPVTARLTVKVSSGSTAVSSVVVTVNVFCSPAVPEKVRAVVFSV